MPKKEVVEQPRVLLLEDGTGEFRVTIGANDTFTFGPAIPGPKAANGYGVREYAVRIYRDGKAKDLRAVFTGVHWVREMGMEVARAVIREQGKTLWKNHEGGYETSTEVAREKKWAQLPDKF